MPKTPSTPTVTLRQLAEREERVFPTYPQVGRYFPAATIEDARARVGRAIERGDGPGLIIGGPGTGKSLLLQVLASQYHERFDVVLPACARLCTRRALLQAILFELGLPYRIREEGDLRLSLLDHLLSREECPTGLLLLVDEAQTLSANLLDELRVLTNLVRGGAPRVRLVLAGSSALEECFAHPDLESFSQRVSARCYLGPFRREETVQFVRAQIAACGASPEMLLDNNVWEAIFDATDGVPRLVNQLCDRALVQAAAANLERIDRQVIQNAWAEIQQLPAPWETPPATTAPPAPLQVVEFGSLAAEPLTSSSAINDRLMVERNDEEEMSTDPTELDLDDEVTVLRPATTVVSAVAAIATSANSEIVAADPFDEEFDEEEVVLDSFASWDDMFRRETPRVQNCRDPSFAALVQSAISTADVSFETRFNVGSATKRAAVMDDLTFTSKNAEREVPTATAGEDTAKWPPLRLAVVSDVAPSLSSIDLDTINAAPAWTRCDAPHDDLAAETLATDGEPVLIVEDDNPAPKAPVRREEYRNLFSRLRSG